jgi:putative salt-induced outer membrane protein YdiY
MVACSGAASAQSPATTPGPEAAGWTGSFGAGLALTQGNSDTSTLNISYDVSRDTGSAVRFRSAGVYLRGESDGARTSNRLALDGRVDRRLNEPTSLFGQVQHLSDEFKQIDYLVSLTAGVSQQLARTARTELAVDASAGVVLEKNPGTDVKTDGAVTAGENVTYRLTPTAEITQRSTALWKTNDFDDSLFIFGLALATKVTAQTQLKAELLDTYKNKPPTVEVGKNDVAVLLSFVYRY